MAWLPKNKVLVPVDFSEAAKVALGAASELAGGTENLHVLHVLPYLSPVEPGVVFGKVTTETRVEKATAVVKERLAEIGFPDVQTTVRVGSPPKEICAHAKKIGADLIVMPAQGRHAEGVFEIGSTTSRVVHAAKCPVLVLKD